MSAKDNEYTVEEDAGEYGSMCVMHKGSMVLRIEKTWWVPGLTTGAAKAGTLEDRTDHHRGMAYKIAALLNQEQRL